jgi:hypothetical protein
MFVFLSTLGAMGMFLSASLKKMMDHEMKHKKNSSSSSSSAKGGGEYSPSTSLGPTGSPSIMGEGGKGISGTETTVPYAGNPGKGDIRYTKKEKSKSSQGKGAGSMVMRLR